jgi:hypothetical protein
MQFSDSISENVALLEELLRGIMPEHRRQAKRAAVQIENVWNALIKDNPKNPAVALGAAFAVYKLAERLGEKQEGTSAADSLIQLL